ncbi:MAG TPA: methyltransferase [Candidatus Omnitrophota bacterium]|nr:methyltransferase [Candidatus Omnitrophota bacterium]HPS20443.1 methyltransferase [Candidatus Omnitrophota bacterium]
MQHIINKDVVKNNFSRNALKYNEYAMVQAQCAQELIEHINGKFDDILEIGCGTGVYTELLAKHFPDSHITAVDISARMIDEAKKGDLGEKVSFVKADGENILQRSEVYDLITSNAVFQWMEDLSGTINNYYSMLKPSGVLAFSIYGPGTFNEFESVIAENFGGERWLNATIFPDQQALDRMFSGKAHKFQVLERKYSQEFNNLYDFLRAIKHSGTRGMGVSRGIFWGPELVDRLERIYVDKYGKIVATHQIFYCLAYKKA